LILLFYAEGGEKVRNEACLLTADRKHRASASLVSRAELIQINSFFIFLLWTSEL